MSITVEKLKSPVYPAYLKVGDYSIAIDAETIAYLKTIAEEDSTEFIEKILKKVGVNRYLREMIKEEAQSGDRRDIMVNRLREGILAL